MIIINIPQLYDIIIIVFFHNEILYMFHLNINNGNNRRNNHIRET